jgi:hypothetical protein
MPESNERGFVTGSCYVFGCRRINRTANALIAAGGTAARDYSNEAAEEQNRTSPVQLPNKMKKRYHSVKTMQNL